MIVDAERDEPLRRLRDVDGVIADALEIARDLDRADDEAEIARHRLLECEQLERGRFDLELHRVDLLVARDHGVRLVLILAEQRVDGELDERLRLLGHGEQAPIQRGELVVEVAKRDVRAHPNLPVM